MVEINIHGKVDFFVQNTVPVPITHLRLFYWNNDRTNHSGRVARGSGFDCAHHPTGTSAAAFIDNHFSRNPAAANQSCDLQNNFDVLVVAEAAKGAIPAITNLGFDPVAPAPMPNVDLDFQEVMIFARKGLTVTNPHVDPSSRWVSIDLSSTIWRGNTIKITGVHLKRGVPHYHNLLPHQGQEGAAIIVGDFNATPTNHVGPASNFTSLQNNCTTTGNTLIDDAFVRSVTDPRLQVPQWHRNLLTGYLNLNLRGETARLNYPHPPLGRQFPCFSHPLFEIDLDF